MQNLKDNTYQKLILTGRKLVEEKGAEFLTARKLSDASCCSIGTIYNQFSSMEEFIAEQNRLTLDELLANLQQVRRGKSYYQNLNNYVDSFTDFVINHQQLWFLLYNFHLNSKNFKLSQAYKRTLVKLAGFAYPDLQAVFPQIESKRLRLANQVLWLAMMAVSSMLSTNILDNMSLVNKNNLCKIMVNTYLAGMMVLNQD